MSRKIIKKLLALFSGCNIIEYMGEDMKKIIGLLLAGMTVALFSGCDLIMDNALKAEAMGHELYYLPEFDSLDTPYKISGWIQSQGIVYDKNDNPINWKNPAIMIRDKKGSCADFAVLFLNIAHYGMKQDGEIVSVTASSRKIEAGGITANHAVCRFGDIIIEPQTGGQVNYRVDYSYSFWEVFK